ncbi:roadblock/LC7 domain-containing protein [Streptomyces marispadix]|uniref:Roadblock/LC7 domain-containing protein n=1 Tax=Streptomyces marispadix TaxID=2922868 RepID=A0ABS9T1W3_9ACTN|nr:roadblock/LC7 domain-containing protein [Streptomyces marispadix]MCH6162524.1 roadblock/LC7 domain-containing protein [Streptomyces marispadix]
MNAPTTRTTGSTQARNLRWLLENLVDEVPGILSVAVVSSDGLLLLASDQQAQTAADDAAATGASGDPRQGDGAADGDGGSGRHRGAAEPPAVRRSSRRSPKGSSADLATIVSGLGSLTLGAAKLMNGGEIRQTVVAMEEGSLFVMSISDGSLLGVHATPDCDMSVIAYHMALFVGRAGHVLTPELRTELRSSMELDK